MKQAFDNWHVRIADGLMNLYPTLDKRWSYDYGVVWKGMAALYTLTGDRKYFDYIRRGMDSFLNADGTQIRDYHREEYNLDYINNGKLLLYLWQQTGDARYKTAAELLLDQLLHQPRTPEGGFWHKQIYTGQMWLDGLYMGEPFYAECAKLFDHAEWFDDITHQFLLVREKTMHKPTGLGLHAWDSTHAQPWANPETGCSPHVWGRAVGWYACAVADTLDYLPQGSLNRHKMVTLLADLLAAVWKAQDKRTHVWLQVMDAPDRPGNYAESSCSAQFIYATAKAKRLRLCKTVDDATLREAWQGAVDQFIEVYKGNAIVTKCCQVAGLGNKQERDGSFAYYMSEPIVANDCKGSGAMLQAAVEMEGYQRP
ncbi:MAG TPA: glycoside hydrolase family 88 protein [Candidatus Limiplasma sp.]|nr:glycoside hydrolase family 88 protein [Candidatus Limiplasma sp.]